MGILWIDAHPDVSTLNDGYPNAHAMVLGTLLGHGAPQLTAQMEHSAFEPENILYVGLQGLHDYQERFLKDIGVSYKVQTEELISDNEIRTFMHHFDHLLVHFDIDVLDEHFFHSTYFANPELVGDGASGGKMTMDRLSEILRLITQKGNVVGFTIAEYLPFDEHRLHKIFKDIPLFTD